ncbi:MAG: alpha/beta fold hydrolase [Alphaproteobacteria bacterium]
MTDYRVFELGDLALQGGGTLADARIVYKTYGTLDEDRSNAILYPTSYSAQHSDIEWLIGPDRVLDPNRYFIVIPNMFTNGLSSSPSNAGNSGAPGGFPNITVADNVHAQRRLLTEALGIDRLALVYGWSMGGQQAYHWGALYPEAVARICVVCGSARTAPHNQVFLEGVKAALTADAAYRDGWFHEPPLRGLKAMARVYAGWALSQAFYREELWRGLGYGTLEQFLVESWEAQFLRRDANDLLAQIWTWRHGDISDNELYRGDLAAALGAIRARALIVPSETDLYFRVADNQRELRHLTNAELRPIPSVWGHRAGNPRDTPQDAAFLSAAVAELLAA